MTINKFDDYDRLAKLLFPSIEASGNVHYGQTKKLITDELFDKNKQNFNTHIETINDKPYFIWQVGSFKGSIQIESSPSITTNTFPNVNAFYVLNNDGSVNKLSTDGEYFYVLFGDIFAKYDLLINNVANDEIISSGSFKSYHLEPECKFSGIYVTRGFNPTNRTDTNILDRNFFVSDDLKSLYIKISRHQLQSVIDHDTLKKTPLTVLNEDDNTLIVTLSVSNTTNTEPLNAYECSINDSAWQPCVSEYTLETGEFVRLRRTTPKLESDGFLNICTSYATPGKRSDGTKVFGNAYSILDSSFENITSLQPYGSKCMQYLFSDVEQRMESALVNAENLLLDAVELTDDCYNSMFMGCVELFNSPKLPAKHLPDSCYKYMFSGCSKLSKAPIINVDTADTDSMSGMFDGCTDNLHKAFVIIKHMDATAVYQMFNNCNKVTLFSDYQSYSTEMGLLESQVNVIKPFTIQHNDYQGKIITVSVQGNNVNNRYAIETSTGERLTWDLSDGNVHSIDLDDNGDYKFTMILLNEPSTQDDNHYVKFSTSGSVDLVGNIHSILSNKWASNPTSAAANAFPPYCCYKMFRDCKIIEDPFLYGTLSDHCFEQMFYGCNLIDAKPLLNETAAFCYSNMFTDNVRLIETPDIYTSYAADSCFKYMFSTASSIDSEDIHIAERSGINIYALDAAQNAFYGIVTVDSAKVNTPNLTSLPLEKDSTVSYNSSKEYNVKRSQSSADHKSDYLVTSGMDSTTNGRGVLDGYTSHNMLSQNPFIQSQFELNNYDKSNGMFNQDIWGYKQFNSPVSFRNGIYGEYSSLKTTDPYNGYVVLSTGDDSTPYISNLISSDTTPLLGSTFVCLPTQSYINRQGVRYNPCASVNIEHVNLSGDYTISGSSSDKCIFVTQSSLLSTLGSDHKYNTDDLPSDVQDKVEYIINNYSHRIGSDSNVLNGASVNAVSTLVETNNGEKNSHTASITSNCFAELSTSFVSSGSTIIAESTSDRSTIDISSDVMKISDHGTDTNKARVSLLSEYDNPVSRTSIKLSTGSTYLELSNSHDITVSCNNVIPSRPATALGTSTNKFNRVFANYVTGELPHVERDSSTMAVPVGSIVICHVTTSSSGTYLAGTYIDFSSSSSFTGYIAKNSGIGGFTIDQASRLDGKFALLTTLEIGASNDGIALVIKVN